MSKKVEVKRHIPGVYNEILGDIGPPRLLTSYHTEECRKRMLYELGRYKDWRWRWPLYCQSCDATGLVCWSENQSPLGSGMYWPEEFEEPCEQCILKGKCPRCRHQHDKDWGYDECGEIYKACELCGWEWNKGEDDILPLCEDECTCWQEEWETDREEVDYPELF